jgi:TM2 domain-containing membrane protein YozV
VRLHVSHLESGDRIDADFAVEILEDLYAYRPKRRWLAFLLWGTLGWFGAHRFYLGRTPTALLMLLTLGGGLIWWIVDAFLIGRMVRAHDDEQARRMRADLPPLELDFMPPLSRDVLAGPPEWTRRWRERNRALLLLYFGGGVLFLVFLGLGLGSVAVAADVWEAIFAVLVLVALVGAGSAVGRVGHLPLVQPLLRWSHRLRLFYYFNQPGSPPALLFRPITGILVAPFRRRARAEVRLYLQLGGVFTLFFLLLDFGGDVLLPSFTGGVVPGISDIFTFWIREATLTFIVIYAFATPIGAVLNRYLLVRRTHTVPRLLCAVVTLSILAGLAR